MEVWQGAQYHDLMSMPTTRRRRFVRKKLDLEEKRHRDHDAAMARARSRR
jgi:hypothetical protein